MYKLSHHFVDPSPCELSDAKLKEKAQRKGAKFFYHKWQRSTFYYSNEDFSNSYKEQI